MPLLATAGAAYITANTEIKIRRWKRGILRHMRFVRSDGKLPFSIAKLTSLAPNLAATLSLETEDLNAISSYQFD
jgi:hypothetical protein